MRRALSLLVLLAFVPLLSGCVVVEALMVVWCAATGYDALICAYLGETAARSSGDRAGTTVAPALTYDAPTFTLSLDDDATGAQTGLQVELDVPQGQRQTHQELITVPADFGFDGFTALGPAHTQVGTYLGEIAVGPMQVSASVPIRVLGPDQAYLDGDDDGAFDGADGLDMLDVDSLIEHTVQGDGSHLFTVTTPYGGDGISHIQDEPAAAHLTASFGALFQNPDTPGSYRFAGRFVSVDPESGGADDGLGAPPQEFTVEATVMVRGDGTPPPSGDTESCNDCTDDDGDGLIDLEDPDCCAGQQALTVRRATLKPRGEGVSRLALKAQLDAGLTRPATPHDVTLQLRAGSGDAFCARFPAEAMQAKKTRLRLKGRPQDLPGTGGVSKLTLRVRRDGATRLLAKAKQGALGTPDPGPVTVIWALRSPGDPDTAWQCSSSTQTFRARRRGTITYP